jgi:glycosyltransferase involved in cell wall biosynthesis
MRIAMVHNLPPGGARRVLLEHARHLDDELVEFCLTTASPVTDAPHRVSYEPVAPKLAPALRPALRYGDLARLLRAWRRLTQQVRDQPRFDVVLAHPCQFLQAPPALAWLAPPGVYFCHEPRRVDYEPSARSTRSARTRHVYAPLYHAERSRDRAAVRAAARIVTNSDFTARRIRDAYGRDATPLPLGVPEGFRAAPSPVAPRHLLSVGALLPTKGHDLVVEAAARARRRWPVTIVAPRPDRAEERRLRALALARGVVLDVRIAITDDELRDAYRQAAATLYLAREEPYGLASLEAQSCGAPVIVAAEGGLPETIVAEVTGWAVPREPAAAAAKIDLLDDAPRRERMAERAAEHGGRLTWRASAAAMHAVLNAAAAR